MVTIELSYPAKRPWTYPNSSPIAWQLHHALRRGMRNGAPCPGLQREPETKRLGILLRSGGLRNNRWL